MSRGSHHSLMVNGRVRSGRTESGRTTDSGRSGSMKCIVTVGIILPLLAAIIGVVAWTLSSDTVHKRSQSSSQYHGGHSSFRSRDNVFEERNDDEVQFGQKLPIGAVISKDVLGPETEEEREVIPSTPQENEPEKDPLYVVHYVQQSKEATSQPPKSDAGNDVLAKILSASKVGQGKGTPQFVVFAPSPVDPEDDEDDMSSRTARKTIKRRKKHRKEMVDYEDDELATHSHVKQQVTSHIPRPRHGDYESPDYHHHWPVHQQQQNYNPPAPCCQHQQPQSTEAPSPGLTIQMGNGLPMSPLGLLRQLLKPKVDLKKKLFFGVQLENGVGFGGDNAGNMPAGGQMGNGGGPMGGNMGHMGGNMGHMGGNMGNMGGNGGKMYRYNGR